MDAAWILDNFTDLLATQLGGHGASASGEFPAQALPPKLRKAHVTVGIGRLAEELELSLTIYAPLEEGAQRCEELYWLIASIAERAAPAGYQGLERGGVKYDAAARCYRLGASARFRKMVQMLFGSLGLRCYADTLRVADGRMIKTFYAPMAGEVVQDLGLRARVVSGQGEFRGQNRDEAFSVFYNLFRETGQDSLSLPGGKRMQAVFSKFVPVEHCDCIRYDFEFTEVPAL